MQATASESKQCFVIAPIGTEGSETRTRSDQVLKHIVAPAARECGYEAIRADQISEPGLITSQVIQHIVDDPLVIADLTGWNPNVFYELALRHALKRPVVQIIHATESIPFDVAASRTIQVDHHDLDSAARARDQIIKQIRAVEANPVDVDTPISVAIELQSLRQSDNPIEKSNAEIITMLQDVRSTIIEMRDDTKSSRRLEGELVDNLMVVHDQIMTVSQQWHAINAAAEEGKPFPVARHEELSLLQRRLQRMLDLLERTLFMASEDAVSRHLLRRSRSAHSSAPLQALRTQTPE